MFQPVWGEKTLVMGVLNVTPDSFSDGGQFSHVDAAVAHARQMVRDGADILDIGGESTRPATFHDSSPLPAEEELRRVLPVIQKLAAELPVPISIDTYKADVARAALDKGAQIVNDISGLTADPDMAPLIAERGVPIIVMHLPGKPRHLPQTPEYADVVGEVRAFFRKQIEYARANGIQDEQIWLDPGLGFGKTAQHNLELLRRLGELQMGFPLVVGASRKRFLGRILGTDDPADRVEGTAATVALSIQAGADVVRVHDVRAMSRVARVSDAIVRGWTGE